MRRAAGGAWPGGIGGDDGRGRRHGGRPRRALRGPARGPGGVRPARPARRAGAGAGHRGPAPAAVRPGRRRRGARRPRRTGCRRRARAPARGCAVAATCSTSPCPRSARSRPPSCASSWPGSPAPRRRRRGGAGPGCARRRSAGAPGSSSPCDDDGRAGLRRHRSHDVVAIDDCRIAAPGVACCGFPKDGGRGWPPSTRSHRRSVSRSRSWCPVRACRRPWCRWCTSGSRPPGRPRAAASSRWPASSPSPRAASGRCTRCGPHLRRGRHGRRGGTRG